jgi:hypothetical protein
MRIALLACVVSLAATSATSVFADDDDDVDDSNPGTADGSWPGPSKDERFCGEQYAAKAKPTPAETLRCVNFFTSTRSTGVWEWKVTRTQLAAMEKNLDACKQCTELRDDVIAILERVKAIHLGVDDPEGTGDSLEPLLATVLAGKPITKRDIVRSSPVALWRLRNAPYARHGRPFKSVELEAFFYGERGGKTGMAASKLLPLKRDPAFKEAMLDKTDKANVAIIVAMIKHKKFE